MLIAKLKIPPFIATLGMMLLLKGLSLVISGTKPIYFNDTPQFPSISQDSLIGYFLPDLPIPNAVLILFVVAVVSSLILNKTVLGRYTFALGSNEEAVRLSGVNVDRWKIIIYSLSGAICGIAGLLIASRSIRPNRRSGRATSSTPSPPSSSAAPRSAVARARYSGPSSAPSS